MSEVEALTDEMHQGAVWKYAKRLNEATDPAAMVWLIAAHATREDDSIRLAPEQFLNDFGRVKESLDATLRNPQAAAIAAKSELTERAGAKINVEDGVPFSDSWQFLAMAVAGYSFGVQVSGNSYFAASNGLDYIKFAGQHNLRSSATNRSMKRGDYLVDAHSGRRVVKFIGPGFALVLGDPLLEDIPEGDSPAHQELRAIAGQDPYDQAIDPAKISSDAARALYAKILDSLTHNYDFRAFAKALARTGTLQ